MLISKIEKNYLEEKLKKYDKNISFMDDIIYIYERIPFINGIKEIHTSKDNNIIYSESYISKNEIQDYIKKFNISVNLNPKFKLMDERTWQI